MVLFTDGAESEHVSTGEFFNPVVQAKRLSYGLGCESTADCRGDAQCESGVCTIPGADPFLVPDFVDVLGEDALVRPNGDPLRIQVSVVTLQADAGDPSLLTQNERIALVGGGSALDVAVQDTDAMSNALLEVMTPAYKCAPETPDDAPEPGDEP